MIYREIKLPFRQQIYQTICQKKQKRCNPSNIDFGRRDDGDETEKPPPKSI